MPRGNPWRFCFLPHFVMGAMKRLHAALQEVESSLQDSELALDYSGSLEAQRRLIALCRRLDEHAHK